MSMGSARIKAIIRLETTNILVHHRPFKSGRRPRLRSLSSSEARCTDGAYVVGCDRLVGFNPPF